MAKFEQVADELSRRVRDGVYTTSQRLPAIRHPVSRMD